MGKMPIADRMTPPCCPARAVAAVIPGGSTLREVSAGTPPGTLDTYGPPDRFTQTVKTGQTFYRCHHVGEHIPTVGVAAHKLMPGGLLSRPRRPVPFGVSTANLRPVGDLRYAGRVGAPSCVCCELTGGFGRFE